MPGVGGRVVGLAAASEPTKEEGEGRENKRRPPGEEGGTRAQGRGVHQAVRACSPPPTSRRSAGSSSLRWHAQRPRGRRSTSRGALVRDTGDASGDAPVGPLSPHPPSESGRATQLRAAKQNKTPETRRPKLQPKAWGGEGNGRTQGRDTIEWIGHPRMQLSCHRPACACCLSVVFEFFVFFMCLLVCFRSEQASSPWVAGLARRVSVMGVKVLVRGRCLPHESFQQLLLR